MSGTDLKDLLQRTVDGSASAPSDELVEADLARAHRARRRRSAVRGARAGVLALAAAGAAVLALQGMPDPGAGAPAVSAAPSLTAPPADPSGSAPTGTAALPAIQLVAWTGAQPAGFTVDKVPEGWEVQGADAGVLTVAPVGAADREVHSFAGKIAVFQQADLPEGARERGRLVRVGGADALAFTNDLNTPGDGLGGTTLFVPQDSGSHLSIQVWSGLGWSDAQLAEFAGGVRATEHAVDSVG